MDKFRKQFAANLNKICDRLDLPISGSGRATELSRIFGMSVPSAHRWLSGGSLPEMEKIPRICAALKCSCDELMFGISDKEPPLSKRAYIPIEQSQTKDSYNLIVSAGFLSQFGVGPFHLLEINSNEMEPYAMEGDYVLYDTSINTPDLSGIYVIEHGSRKFLRRVQMSLNGHLSLLCDNEQFSSQEFLPLEAQSQQDIAFLGKVAARVLVRR